MIIKQKTKTFYLYLFIGANFFNFNMVHAQFRNNNNIYISDNSAVFIEGDNYEFGLGTVATSRTKVDYGVLCFSQGASWEGANEEYFVDGYAKTESNDYFILPIGHSGVYAPIQVIPSNSEGVNAAYFRKTPRSIGTQLSESISSISSVEYWNIESKGINAGISLSYRPSSAVYDLTSYSLANLSIVGWDGKVWVAIPSTVDEYSILGKKSSLEYGSISSNAEIDLSRYSEFSLGNNTNEIDIDLIVYINESRLFIEASLPVTALSIYDMQGKVIFSGQMNGSLKHEQAFNNEENIYLIQVELKHGASVITKKVINRN
jgi:hypothetical protein